MPCTLSSQFFERRPPDATGGGAAQEVDTQTTMCCVDVGMYNLGLAFMSHDESWRRITVVEVGLVDLVRQGAGSRSKEPCDRLEKFFASTSLPFRACEAIFVERQPLVGMKAIEQLIFWRFRDRAHLISPNSVQARFGITKRLGFGYDERKVAVTRIAGSYLAKHGSRLSRARWGRLQRKHDVADAIVMGMYVSEVKRMEWRAVFGAGEAIVVLDDGGRFRSGTGDTDDGGDGCERGGKGFRSTQEGCRKMLSPFFSNFSAPSHAGV